MQLKLCLLAFVAATTATALPQMQVPTLTQPPPNHPTLLQIPPTHTKMDPSPNQMDTPQLVQSHLEERKSIYQRRHLTSESCSTTTPSVAVGQNFSLGGLHSSYSNAQSCTWIVEDVTHVPAGGTIGIAFTFFHTEENDDKVQIFDADTNAAVGLPFYSGDLITPFIIGQSGVHRLKVVFTANEAVSESSRTLQLGFSATVYNAGADCYDPSCNNHGTCSSSTGSKPRTCECTPLASPTDYNDVWLGGTCSTQVSYLAPNTPKTVTNVPMGEWSYYWSAVDSTTKYLVDFKDTGLPDSDPLLVLGSASTMSNTGEWNPVIPRLSSSSKYYEDYLSWYYDRTDVHYIHFKQIKPTRFNGNRAIIAIYNHIARTKAAVSGELTVRTSSTNSWPCILDCSGSTHGTCVYPGLCKCKDPWYGNGWRTPSTCSFEMKDITSHLDQKIGTAPDAAVLQQPLRVGAWAYLKLRVDPNWVQQRTIAVDFTSLSPHAQPIVVVRKNNVPRLKYGFLPTYDAFAFDYGDKEGFELLQGQRQNIIIQPSEVTSGSYFIIGIYDIWGHTALPEESHDSVNYTLYINKYAAGVPCPKDTTNNFCAGQTCDFNTGICDCPPNALGLDCSMVAAELNPTTSTFVEKSNGLAVKSTDYFYVSITKEQANSKLNLMVDLIKLNPTEKSFPVLLARQGAIPYGTDRSLFDDHDFVSRYHESETHRILLDRDELQDHGASLWYFAVVNEEDPNSLEDPLTYKIRARLLEDVDCLSSSSATICSGHGTCDRSLGRCTCTEHYTGDDCGDAGVYPLVLGTVGVPISATVLPPIPVDEWVYYSLSIGCNTTIKVEFTTSSTGSRPLIVMEKDRLPLMVDSTHEYDDYYSGVKSFSHHQVIRIAPCASDNNIGGQLRCYIHPLYPGTDWKTGSPAPGEWYIGIYNDPNVGAGSSGVQPNPIVDYTLKVTQETSCTTCASGFRKPTKLCQTTCPGMHPEQHEIKSNSPMEIPAPCDGHGTCSVDGSTCSCRSSYYGLDCSTACPSDSKHTVCSGHGTCDKKGEEVLCTCDSSYGGTKCDVSCPTNCNGHGSCAVTDGNPLCKCNQGYSGSQCSHQCPIHNNLPCSGHGKCTSKQSSESATETGYCQCDGTHTGNDCSIVCPLSLDNKVCSGQDHGRCNNDGTCLCTNGYDGPACDEYELCPDNCNNHGTCIGDTLSTKKCSCKRGFVGIGCQLQCPVTSLSGAICNNHGVCSELNGKPICTCDATYTGNICDVVCPLGSPNNNNESAAVVCSNHGTCMVDSTDEAVATCACFDGYGGTACSSLALTEEEALKQAQNKVDSGSIVIATIVTIVAILIIGTGTFIYRRTKSRLQQYEVTFGTDALLGPMNGGGGGGSGGDIEGNGGSGGRSGKRGRGRSVRRTTEEGSDSLAAEDVLAIGAMSVQMQEIDVSNGSTDYVTAAE